MCSVKYIPTTNFMQLRVKQITRHATLKALTKRKMKMKPLALPVLMGVATAMSVLSVFCAPVWASSDVSRPAAASGVIDLAALICLAAVFAGAFRRLLTHAADHQPEPQNR